MTEKKEVQIIQSRIYEIRGYKVMIDRDLAAMYQVETKVLNQAVKRNIERFPEDFMFQLTDDEFLNWRSQFVTSNHVNIMGLRRRPYAFTELGVAMLSSVLNSKTAIQINMGIMRAFVAMRQLVLNTPEDKTRKLQSEVKELREYIEEVFTDYNDINEDTRIQLELINETLAELQNKNKEQNKPRRRIGYLLSPISYLPPLIPFFESFTPIYTKSVFIIRKNVIFADGFEIGLYKFNPHRV